MSEDADESSKTEEPTDKKLTEAHERGSFAISREVHNWLMIAAALAILVSVVPKTMTGLEGRLIFYMEHLHELPLDHGGVGAILLRVIADILWALWLPVLLLGAAGVAGTILQTGWHVSWTLISPKYEKLNPMTGLGRMFNASQLVELAKSIAKIIIVGGIAYTALTPMLFSIEHFINIDLMALVKEMGGLSHRLFVGVFAIMTAIAGADVAWQRYQYNKKMRMTKQEVKDEHKQTEGDPHIKARLRQIRFERARKRMMAAVPSADVVVTNPTHFAVALKYDATSMGAPVVVAKGIDQIALKIREVAEDHDIPVVENPPLARALHASVEIDDEIPSEHYRAVAEVITYVFKLKGRR